MSDLKLALLHEIGEAEAVELEARRELLAAMRRASAEGLTLREIAEVTTYSREWVRKQLAPERPAPEWRDN
jgi:predicted ATPase